MCRFIGNGGFCLKLCLIKAGVTQPNYCENRYDQMGCEYNMPNNLIDGTFTECESDPALPVGEYVVNGISKCNIVFWLPWF